ncbi:MAG TPA: class I SAM-dependent rRNA methyltransferase [Terriglobales bacterium]
MVNGRSIPQVKINERAMARLRGGHVWVYASDVIDSGGATAGDLAHVTGPKAKMLGSAIFSSASQIQLRLVCREQLHSEDELIKLTRQRLAEAIAYRARMVRQSDAYRLVFSEGDCLPGLIVDRYNDVTTLQVLTQAWDRPLRKQAIIAALLELTGAEHIVERVDPRIRALEQLPELKAGFLSGTKSSTVFTLNGERFHYDALGGQKTGAFLDQRENYAASTAYARGQALDVCTYHGGFALHLARVCEQVTALDISREALVVAEQNEKLNAGKHRSAIEWIEANAFDLLKDYAAAGRQYDAIVLDPPAFAKSKRNLPAAMRGYKELNLRAFRMLRPGGVLLTCSCSFAVSEAEFLAMLTDAAQDTHRLVKVLERRGAAQDHPSLLGVPETSYLKCIIAVVD